jgi:hypothetical protein
MTNATTAPVQSLHDQIMHLPCTPPKDANVNQAISYRAGHRDARHAAAELAAAYEADAPVAVPDGFTIVPAEPTPDMLIQMLGYEDDRDCYRAMIEAAPNPPALKPRNNHGIDAHYFHKKLNLVLRDFECFTPDELARTLVRLARVADESVLQEREFEPTWEKELASVAAMVEMLENREWAEHVGQLGGPLSRRLEAQITLLHDERHEPMEG